MTVEITHSGIGIDVLGTNNTPMVVEVALQRDGKDGKDGSDAVPAVIDGGIIF